MATKADDVNQFLQGGGKSFPFEEIGDRVRGQIIDMERRQQTDLQTNEPRFFPNGQPMFAVVITLQTELSEDETDDGQRTVWIRGGNYTPEKGTGASSLNALKDALRKANSKDIDINGFLEMELTGMGKQVSRGFSPPKLYTMVYEPPSKAISVDELG
jgi:hypothetical protein